jgi:gliding motility-associated-like protein
MVNFVGFLPLVSPLRRKVGGVTFYFHAMLRFLISFIGIWGCFVGCIVYPLTAQANSVADTVFIEPSKIITNANICEAFPLTLEAMTMGVGTLEWSDGSKEKTLKITDFGTYTVTFTTDEGVFTATYELAQPGNDCCRALFPNVFTPDGDDTNEIFSPVLQYCETEYAELYVYSRWGELMYQGYSESERWDGKTLNGTDAQTDVYGYVYRYKLKGESSEKVTSGEVTLLR